MVSKNIFIFSFLIINVSVTGQEKQRLNYFFNALSDESSYELITCDILCRELVHAEDEYFLTPKKLVSEVTIC